MPNYRTHAKVNLLFALPLLLFGTYGLFHVSKSLLITFGASFSYATLFMNPDLDLVHNIKLFSIRGILSLPFRGYSRIFSHRGLSHSFLFGSLTRLLYLLLVALVLLTLLNIPFPSLKGFFIKNSEYCIWALVGIFIADIMHVLLDKLFTKQ